VFEGNRFSGSLPASWGAMRALQVLDVRGMCGVCGSVPFKQMVRLGLQGSSLGWPCGRGNCSGLPLGFLGQAVIISAILLTLVTLCMWRRLLRPATSRLAGLPDPPPSVLSPVAHCVSFLY
jgi:hypothetical protein